MAIYRVHLPVGADAASAAERARFQREGFSWPALLFGPVWLLARGIWRALTVWLAAALALGWAIHLGRLPSADGTWFVLLSAIYLGLEGNSLAAAALERRGYKLADIAGAGAQNPAGYEVMLLFFFLLSLAALLSAVLLWRREAGPKGHNLESARAGA